MTSFSVSLYAASVLVVLLGVFMWEDKRGRRFGEPVRRLLDRGVDGIVFLRRYVVRLFSHGRLRLLLHWFIHKTLQFAAWSAHTAEAVLLKLQRRNRRAVRSLTRANNNSHLAQMKAHKRATALSSSEKEELKEKATRW